MTFLGQLPNQMVDFGIVFVVVHKSKATPTYKAQVFDNFVHQCLLVCAARVSSLG